MVVKLSDVKVGSACTVIEIKGGLRVRRYLAKLSVEASKCGLLGWSAEFWQKQLSL